MHKTFEQFLDQDLERMPGWCVKQKAVLMYELIRSTNPKLVVEIGVFGGRSLVPQAMALAANKAGKIYGIDPWKTEPCLEGENDKANDEWWKSVDLEKIYQLCQVWIQRTGVEQYCELVRGSSQDVVDQFNDIDILHVDGSHSELVSCRDVTLYLPKVRPGGYIWMDDILWRTTVKAQEILQQHAKLIQTFNNFALYQKS